MRRAFTAGLLVLTLGLGACGEEPSPDPGVVEAEIDYGVAPQRLELEGVAASVKPPAGVWLLRSGTPAPEQFYEQLRRDDGTVLRASVFPTQSAAGPAQVLPRAIDLFVRGLGTDGFGQSGRGADLAWGAPVAWSRFTAVVDGRRVTGHARLLRVDPGHWAFAIGLAPDAEAKGPALVERFVASLEPSEVTFYTRVFANQADLAAVVARPDGEPTVTRRDLAAVQLVIEAGTGVRFPLASMPMLLDALADEARDGTPEARASFRDTAATLEKTRTMAPAERAVGMRALGQRILKAVFDRVLSGYQPAQRYKAIWDALGKTIVGERPDGLSAASVRCQVEMSAFLASIAADGGVQPGRNEAAAVHEGLTARWPELDADARKDLAHAGTPWAALRYAWDAAEPAGRRAFRQAVLVALVAPELADEVGVLADDRALHAWIYSHARLAPDYLVRAAALSAADRARLIAHLGVDGSGYHLGW